MVIPVLCIQLQNEIAFNFLGKVYFYLTLVEMTLLSPTCPRIIRQLRCFMVVLLLTLALGLSFFFFFIFFFEIIVESRFEV